MKTEEIITVCAVVGFFLAAVLAYRYPEKVCEFLLRLPLGKWMLMPLAMGQVREDDEDQLASKWDVDEHEG